MENVTKKELDGTLADIGDLLHTIIDGISDGSIQSSPENYHEMINDLLNPPKE